MKSNKIVYNIDPIKPEKQMCTIINGKTFIKLDDVHIFMVFALRLKAANTY